MPELPLRPVMPRAGEGSAGTAAVTTGDLLGGRFLLAEEVRRGGMGRIHGATDRLTGARVAVKLLRPDTDEADRFLLEASVLAGLDHPHIVQHLGHGSERG